ncbi:MAG TPA: NAD(P)-dependent oxidoreductase [Gemmataceae bacterium]|nr:NAD(P)-dependent oxidoreductase [Gemmataceae bacterium]
MPTVLITGASGFLGRPCLERLAGCAVHAVARSALTVAGVQTHAVDLLDPAPVSALLNTVRPTHLLHLAWVTTPGAYWTSPANERWLEASLHLAREFLRHGGRRLLLAGTCAEYDWTAAGVCHEQTTPLRPATLYGRCKHALRLEVEALARKAGAGAAWARLFFPYGPGERPERLVPSVARALLRGGLAECSAGTQRRDFIHVADAADALVRLLHSEVEGPVNVGTGEAAAVRDVALRIARLLGAADRVRLGVRPLPPGEPPLLIADVTRLRTELRWVPRFGLDAGLADAVAWWKEQGRAAA